MIIGFWIMFADLHFWSFARASWKHFQLFHYFLFIKTHRQIFTILSHAVSRWS